MRIVEQKAQCSECRKYYPITAFTDSSLPTECSNCVNKFIADMCEKSQSDKPLHQKQHKHPDEKYEKQKNRYTIKFIPFDQVEEHEREDLRKFFVDNFGVLFKNKNEGLSDMKKYFYNKHNKLVSHLTIRRLLQGLKLRAPSKKSFNF